MPTTWNDEPTGDGRWTVHVSGDLDLESGPGLRDHLASVLSRRSHVVIDLTELGFCDSSGLGALVATRRRADLLGCRLVLRFEVRGRVHRLLELSGLISCFEVDLVEGAPLT